MSASRADSAPVNPGPAGWRGTRRYVPPTVNSLLPEAERDAAAATEAARANGLAEGHARGWAEGRESGFHEGKAKARAELESRIAALEEELAGSRARHAVATTLERLLAARDADRSALETACRGAIVAALRTLFPALLARGLGAEVAALVTAAVAAHPADRIAVCAHPETPAAALLRDLAAGSPGRIALEWDGGMGVAALEIAWADHGGVAADWAALLARIAAVLDGGAPPAPDGNRAEET